MALMIRILAMAVLISSVLASCRSGSQATHQRPPRPARINHLAFFKLKNPGDSAELIADCDAKLATIPGVKAYYAGTHLDTGRGDRVDGNYDVGFYVGFESAEDYAAYVAHPDHVALVKKWRPKWEWIRVQDVLDETR